jgi:hypothetical protein
MHKQYVFCLHVLCVNCTVCSKAKARATLTGNIVLQYSKERAEWLENWPGQNFALHGHATAEWKSCGGGECSAMINCSDCPMYSRSCHLQYIYVYSWRLNTWYVNSNVSRLKGLDHQINIFFLTDYKIKLILYVHAQMIFKTLACLVQEENKYKFFACFLSILKIVPKYAVSGFFRFHWLIFFIVKFRLHQFSSLSISLWSPPAPPSIRQILYAQKCGKQYQLLLQLITSLVFLYHRGRKRPMRWL